MGSTPSRASGTVLIIGIGNELREDDAAGLMAARALREAASETLRVVEHGGEGASLMTAWEGMDCVFLCDAVSSSEAPGTVLRIEAHRERIPPELRACSSHAFGVAEAIETGRALGTLPRELIVFGIVGKRFAAGTALSHEAEAGVAEAVCRIRKEIAARRGASPPSARGSP